MQRVRLECTAVLVSLLVCTVFPGCAGGGRAERADGFELKPYAVPLQRFYFPARISAVPRTCVATSASKLGTETIFGHFLVRDVGSRLATKPFTLKLTDKETGKDILYYATEYLAADKCLAQSLGLWPSTWTDRNAIQLALFDLSTGGGEVITPSNITEMSLVQQDVPPRVFYDDVNGLTFLMEDRGSLRIFAYRGDERVYQTAISPKGVAGGYGFVSGRLTYGLVTRKREMLFLDYDTGEFRPAEEFKQLAGEVYMALSVQVGTALNRFKEYVVPMSFAEGLAVLKTDEDILLVAADGKRKALTRRAAEGAPKVEDENVMPLVVTTGEAMAGRKQGQSAPPSTVSLRCNTLAWDDEHVAVFDAEAQRLIVASLDKST